MSLRPRARPGVFEIEPYVGGESSVPGRNRIFKLSSNESPLGPSPAAIEAYRAAASELAAYPKGDPAELRTAIARAHDLEADRIVLGCGSDELLHLLAQAYLGPGDEAISTAYSFIVYRIVTSAASGRNVLTPERAFRADIDAILAAVTARTRLVFLANPNNPTGTYISGPELARLHVALPRDVLLVVDAAYAEYVEEGDYSTGEGLARRHDNVVMTRTFSKAYGLAGLRLGWAYCPPSVHDALERIRGPFNTSVPAQAAGLAAVSDRAHLKLAVEHNRRWLPELSRAIAAMGIEVVPSVGNFLLLEFGSVGRADAADRALRAEGLILRGLKNYGMETMLRLSVGSEEANRLVVETLGRFVKAAG
ncbi:MAG: histidinol-phosphate transaminase [Alphaproteobacteria bacterium]